MSSYTDDYDYDEYAPHITIAHVSYLWEESTFPAGSGAGVVSSDAFATTETVDDFDRDIDQEDEECLASFVQQNQLADACYLVFGQTFASGVASGNSGQSSHVQHYHVHGYHCTDKVPPKFDGTDLNNWIKAARYWMDNSTLQEKNKVPSIVNNLTGLATRWMEVTMDGTLFFS